jgi:hypothetical protein
MGGKARVRYRSHEVPAEGVCAQGRARSPASRAERIRDIPSQLFALNCFQSSTLFQHRRLRELKEFSAMNDADHRAKVGIASGINVLLGIWLIFSPWLYGYVIEGVGNKWNSALVGSLITICAALRYSAPQHYVGLSVVNAALGVWCVLSPWIFAYSTDTGRSWSSVILGIVVIALAAFSGCFGAKEQRGERHPGSVGTSG